MHEKLTTTSYAILGHLAMQPWTMYELARQMRRNVHFFYPRAESQVYAEPKRLTALKLATSSTVNVGRRRRTVYEITPAGRDALSEWLAAPVAKGPLLEFEGLLRVLLAPFGGVQDLLSTLDQVRSEIGGLLQMSATIRGEYLAGRAPFQRYAPSRAMIHDFLTNFAVLVESWAERSMDSARRWEAMPVEEQHARALKTFDRNAIDRLAAPRAAAEVAAPASKSGKSGAHTGGRRGGGGETAQSTHDLSRRRRFPWAFQARPSTAGSPAKVASSQSGEPGSRSAG
jgi:DNA-binding PadR family transcriptional regulator